ncbi:hypothetical protein GCM10025867_07120 [Frondihabitans sucicola]|uniref:Sugar ABC transporter permease n=1 Tax=Frondihabitans sucicola TaxID=1268041 RepID=A0ABM8GJA4_9MICO|nr:hypothetical protein [Frondihabitans sucicola]BDZ48471.1 hypothetical protein GCM10025867_07120 [Frondihabitans sucicola]
MTATAPDLSTAAIGTAGSRGPGPGRAGRRSRRAAPYLLSLAGGAWLLVLFVIPLVSGLIVSLMSGNPEKGYSLTWNWSVYSNLFVDPAVPYLTFFVRSLIYGVRRRSSRSCSATRWRTSWPSASRPGGATHCSSSCCSAFSCRS